MRLGFAVKVVGRAGLRDSDGRRWRNSPHLGVSIQYLSAIFDYLRDVNISMYRISSRIAPYITHPELPQFHQQVEECADELAQLGERARAQGLRLSMHPEPFTVLNSPHERVALGAERDLDYHARFLDAMGLGPEAVIVIHGGGVFGEKGAAMDRFVARYARLPERVRRRLVLENDERSYSVADIVALHERTGVPLILDNLHHHLNNPEGWSDREAAEACLRAWPTGVRPKIHFSSRRADEQEGARLDSRHAEFINPDEFARFYHATRPWDYDVMLEAKQKDVALLRLRAQLAERDIATD
ncbi:MAG TPA: UV DNA damage repair endonuclease UvsE [Ktedonobacterales bacterium]|nr:UV DNA damage repair endonuclease UvsE [Ktedonobacterales bacterium]